MLPAERKPSEQDDWYREALRRDDERRSAKFRNEITALIDALTEKVERTARDSVRHKLNRELNNALAKRARHLGGLVDPRRETACAVCARLHHKLGEDGDE